jgi:hypothetical protein
MLQKMLDFSGFYAKNSDGVEIVLHAIAAISGILILNPGPG